MSLFASSPKAIARLCTASLGLWLLLLALFIQARLKRADTEMWVDHTYEVHGALNHVLLASVDAETGARGYALTGEQKFLEPLIAAQAAMPRFLDDLQSLVSDNPEQTARMAALRQSVAANLAIAADATMTQKPEGMRSWAEKGKETMDGIRVQIATMAAAEARYMKERVAQRGRAMRMIDGLSLSLLAVQIGLFVLLGFAVRQWIKAHGIAVICAWSRTIKDEGEWISFEEYLRRRFDISTTHGISPEHAARLDRQIDQME